MIVQVKSLSVVTAPRPFTAMTHLWRTEPPSLARMMSLSIFTRHQETSAGSASQGQWTINVVSFLMPAKLEGFLVKCSAYFVTWPRPKREKKCHNPCRSNVMSESNLLIIFLNKIDLIFLIDNEGRKYSNLLSANYARSWNAPCCFLFHAHQIADLRCKNRSVHPFFLSRQPIFVSNRKNRLGLLARIAQ